MTSKKKTKRKAAAKTAKRAAPARARKAAPARAAKRKKAAAKKRVSLSRPPKARAARPKGAVKAKARPAARPAVKRRDGAGHLDPQYARELRARSGKGARGSDRAFLDGRRSDDSLTEELGEEFVETVTSGEDEGNEVRDRRVVEEVGGPFTVTTAGTEFAEGEDPSNPKGATREPFPRT